MKILASLLLLLSLISCSHQLGPRVSSTPIWFASSQDNNNSQRSPAFTNKAKNLEEFIQALKDRRKIVPVGHEVVETRYQNGKTEVTKQIYLKQNEHGYFDLTWSKYRNGELTAHNFETDYLMFISQIRNAVESGKITEITKLTESEYELKGQTEEATCTSKFDFKNNTSSSSCHTIKGEVLSSSNEVIKKVDLADYEETLRDTTITICSNVLSGENGTTCESSANERDWWAFLFEEE